MKALIVSVLGILLLPKIAWAQSVIVPDETLGTERSLVNQSLDLIEGGARRGQNLFHSFREFNVGDGLSAYFVAPDLEIQNIFARVTGANRSEILGVLGTQTLVNGNVQGSPANLFLLNPNGILFGANARLDVGGSFVATTANAIQFRNAGDFSASTPSTPSSLLTIQPSAFLFNQLPVGVIANNSTADAGTDPSNSFSTFGLRVPDGGSLLLLGGTITSDGGGLVAFGGRIDLGGVAEVGSVELNTSNNVLSLNFPDDLTRADVFLSNGSGFLATTGGGGGDIKINARNIDLSGDSSIQAGIGRNLGVSGSQAGDIILNATGNVNIIEGSDISNSVSFNSNGNSGDINIRAESLFLSNGAQIQGDVFGKGNSGDIIIGVTDLISIDGRDSLPAGRIPSAIFNSVQGDEGEVGGEGNAGDISITAGSFRLTNRAQILSNTEGKGNAGNISISAQKEAFLLNSAIISEVTDGLGEGNGGNITITADSLVLQNGSSLLADSEYLGNAGNITIVAPTAVILEGQGPPAMLSDSVTSVPSQISSTVEFKLDTDRSRQGGNISISTDMLSITDGGFITSKTEDKGNAGDIRFQVGTLSTTNRSFIETSTLGEGNAGNIQITASDRVLFQGSSTVLSRVESGSVGNGGNIEITAPVLELRDGARLSASTLGTGDAGNVQITASDRVLFQGTSADGQFPSAVFSTVESGAVGTGGDIVITAPVLEVLDGARLSSSTLGQGDAGNVTMTVRDAAIFDGVGGAVSAVAPNVVGKGGALSLSAGSLSINNGAQLTSSTLGQGDAGSVSITVRDILQVTDGLISTFALQSSGGSIDIAAKSMRLSNSNIITSVFSDAGAGGDITLTAQSIIALSDSNIFAFSLDGKGGNITLNTRAFFGQNYRPAPLGTNPLTLIGNDRVDINASGRLSSGTIVTPDTSFIQNNLSQLSTDNINPEQLIAKTCIVRQNDVQGRFAITGNTNLPNSPGTIAPSSYATATIQTTKTMAKSDRPWKLGDPIIEPTGFYRLADDRLVMGRECSQ